MDISALGITRLKLICKLAQKCARLFLIYLASLVLQWKSECFFPNPCTQMYLLQLQSVSKSTYCITQQQKIAKEENMSCEVYEVCRCQWLMFVWQGYIPDPYKLREFVCIPPPGQERLHCTMVRQGDTESSGGHYTLYLEYMGGLIPLLKGKRASKLRPEFVIYDPKIKTANKSGEFIWNDLPLCF